eukprot:167346_1
MAVTVSVAHTVENRSLRSQSQRRTKCGGEEEKQEIEAPWNAPCLPVGPRSVVSARDNPTPPIPLQNLVLDVVVEDNKNKISDVDENDPETIAEASIASDG